MGERGYRAHPLTSMILTEGPVEMLRVGQLANDCVRGFYADTGNASVLDEDSFGPGASEVVLLIRRITTCYRYVMTRSLGLHATALKTE